MKINLTDLSPEQIAEALGLKPFQGKQIYHWLHAKQVFDFSQMTDLSKELRRQLADTCAASQVELSAVSASRESPGTRKVLFRLADGEMIEAVLIRDGKRRTICVSTQVGCPVKCAFCATGLSGFQRNLSPGEIVEQVLYLLRDEKRDGRTPNIVYMGMGEPFLNYDATMASIRLLMRKEGLGVGARKITVSTAGVVPGIRRFAQENWQVRLSISLHAGNDSLRSELVPLNRKYPLSSLLAAVRDYVERTGRQVTFEWVLLDGVNDSARDAAELADRVGRLSATVNLIPYNHVAGLSYQPSPLPRARAFQEELAKRGIRSTLRIERGGDIDAACGQLRRQHR